MDPTRFDRVARSLAVPGSRRGTLGLALGGALGLLAAAPVEAARRHRRRLAPANAPCAQFCADARTTCRDICLGFGAQPQTIAFVCPPTGADGTGTCRHGCACYGGVNPPGPADPAFCQEWRSFCQQNCRAFGDVNSMRCSPAERIATCACLSA
jgi:hypothetical protein